MRDFLVRLIAFAALFGVVERVAVTLWSRAGLDDVTVLHAFHHDGIAVLLTVPLLLALLGGVRALRAVVVFVAFFLAGAALAAPFVFARFAGV
jgi:hypothetical protein